MSSFVALQVPVTIRNLVTDQCIIDEGASTCIMSTFIWKNLGSPTTSLCTYNGRASQPQGILMNVPIELKGKHVLIDIKVVNS